MRRTALFAATAGVVLAVSAAGQAAAAPVRTDGAGLATTSGYSASGYAASASWLTAHHVRRACAGAQPAGTMACQALVRTNVTPMTARKARSAAAAPTGLGPADLQAAYNLTSAAASGGSGQTVALVDAFDYPDAASDLAAYRAQFGLPALTSGQFKRVDQNGGTSYPAGDTGWNTEEALDLDMVSAICPRCNIVLVEADSATTGDLGTAENTAASSAGYISNSWGGGEDSSQTSADSRYFTHPGKVITASTGDSGYGVIWPSSADTVVGVGGTSLSKDSSARGWTEKAWDGAGSGCSSVEAKPSWQSDTGCSNKTVADVSAEADPATGVAVYQAAEGGFITVGGTSASSPMIAAVYALAGSPGANPPADPYSHTTDLNDVTSGSNGSCSPSYLCTAGTGYDGPTGLGTPNGTAAFTG